MPLTVIVCASATAAAGVLVCWAITGPAQQAAATAAATAENLPGAGCFDCLELICYSWGW
jgi:hypothetical protein